MSRFLLNTIHYAKRATRDYLETLLILIIPLGLIIIYGMVFYGDNVMLDGYNVVSSVLAPAFILSFQFFAGGTMLLMLFKDLKGEMRNRLGVAPCSKYSFLMPAFFANWLYSICNALILIVVTALFLNVYWGNPMVLALVFALVSLIAILIFAIVFAFTKTYSAANGLVYVISFGMMLLGGWLLVPIGGNPVGDFLLQYSPLALGINAIVYSGMINEYALIGEGRGIEQSWVNIAILAAIALALGLIAVVSTRKMKI